MFEVRIGFSSTYSQIANVELKTIKREIQCSQIQFFNLELIFPTVDIRQFQCLMQSEVLHSPINGAALPAAGLSTA